MKIAIAAILLLLCACEAEPMKIDNPSRLRNKIQYFTDHKGNCFAVVGIRMTGRASMNGIGLTHVPKSNCD